MSQKKLYISSDHAGFQLKKELLALLGSGVDRQIIDLGPTNYDQEDDYPDFAIALAQKVVQDHAEGILICKNGIGVCVAANKVKGARAGIGYNLSAAESMRKDDDTNIICLASEHTSTEHSAAIVKKWLNTPFSQEERHKRRIQKIAEFEKKRRLKICTTTPEWP